MRPKWKSRNRASNNRFNYWLLKTNSWRLRNRVKSFLLSSAANNWLMKKTNSSNSYKRNLMPQFNSHNKPFKLRKNSLKKKQNFKAKSICKRYLSSSRIWSSLSLRNKLSNKLPLLTKLWLTLFNLKSMKFRRLMPSLYKIMMIN